jgi:hypothetical protein|tara:strand:- start:9804 stop:9986 length:183 start_codon:yes stop_codon:yes gene_type:complete
LEWLTTAIVSIANVKELEEQNERAIDKLSCQEDSTAIAICKSCYQVRRATAYSINSYQTQ